MNVLKLIEEKPSSDDQTYISVHKLIKYHLLKFSIKPLEPF